MKQLLIVDTNTKTLKFYEDNTILKTIKNILIGKNGTIDPTKKREGDSKTPLGLYNLGVSFGINKINTKYPYIKIKDNDYWVDDLNSKYYNQLVRLKEKITPFNYKYILSAKEKEFTSAEHLIEYTKEYEYAVFIEYNTNHKLQGSAIFLHCYGTKEYTGGCIAINKEDMQYIINKLDIKKEPQILIK